MSYDSNLERDEYPQQYDHEYYGQSNYNQELDRHRMFMILILKEVNTHNNMAMNIMANTIIIKN